MRRNIGICHILFHGRIGTSAPDFGTEQAAQTLPFKLKDILLFSR